MTDQKNGGRSVHPTTALNRAEARDHTPVNRPTRVPLYKQKHMGMPNIPGFRTRWVNDVPGRLDAFLAAGWTFIVADNVCTNEGTAGLESQMGSALSKAINKSSSDTTKRSYGMKIPETLYNEDQIAKAEAVVKNNERSRQANKAGMYTEVYEQHFSRTEHE